MTRRSTLRSLTETAMGRALPWLGSLYVRLVFRTTRWTWIGREALDMLIAGREPFIVAFWHGRILMMVSLIEETSLPIKVVISANRDGDLITRTIAYFGGDTIRGSSRDPRKKHRNKGGVQVVRSVLEHLRGGGIVAITPDGPRGPRMTAQKGVAATSIQSGLPVVPLGYSIRLGLFTRNWDRFLIPFPFGRGAYVIGDRIAPPPSDDDNAVEVHRQRIETALNAVTLQADEAVGRTPILPA